MDLLLQLVNRAEVSIYDIPVAKITDQYLSYLRAMPEPDLETAADFLVLAATLLALKARLLLPVSSPTGDEGEDSESEEDPRDELVRRLVLYQQYREGGQRLSLLMERGNQRFDCGAPPPPPPESFPVEPGCLSGELSALVLAYQAVLAALEAEPVQHEVSPLSFTVGEKMSDILERLERLASLPFDELLPAGRTRQEVVATFLALLELIRQGRVRARQEQPWGRLDVVRAAGRPTHDAEEEWTS